MNNTLVKKSAVFGQVEGKNSNNNQNENRMQKKNTQSAGASHPAAKMDNRGKNEVNIPVFTNRITFMEWADSMLYNHVWSEFIEYVTYHNPCAFKLTGLDVEEIEMDEELSRAYNWLAGINFRNLPLNTLNAQFIVGGAIHTLRESVGSIDATEFIDYLDDNHGAFDWAKEDMRNFADSKGLVITDDVKAA